MFSSTTRRFVSAGLLFLLVASFAAADARADTAPPRPTAHVTDLAGVLAPGERDQLERKLKAIESLELALAIIYIMDRVPEGAVLEEFTLGLANEWGVGRKGVDDGVSIFVFVGQRTVRIEVGLGLEKVVTNEIASGIIRNQLAPAFRQGQYGKGLSDAVDELVFVLAAARRR